MTAIGPEGDARVSESTYESRNSRSQIHATGPHPLTAGALLGSYHSHLTGAVDAIRVMRQLRYLGC
jgi:hypothetical protein